MLYNLEMVAILLANTRKSLKLYCFESDQNLVSFIDMKFFFVFFFILLPRLALCFNLFLNFVQK